MSKIEQFSRVIVPGSNRKGHVQSIDETTNLANVLIEGESFPEYHHVNVLKLADDAVTKDEAKTTTNTAAPKPPVAKKAVAKKAVAKKAVAKKAVPKAGK